jgi:phospholipase/carboxylesterase
MVNNNFPGIVSKSRLFTLLFWICIVSLNLFSHAEKKDVPFIADYEKIDPTSENAVDFLGSDFDKILFQANRFVNEKKYFEAAQCYLALLKFNLNDSTTIYNLACCYGHLGKADLAVKSLVMAVRAGFRDFKLLKSDQDFDGIRNSPEFMKLLSMLPVWEEIRSEVLYVKTSKLQELLVSLPQGFDSSRKYPLLIGLHGNGGNSEQVLTVMRNALKEEPLILATPLGAYPNYSQLRGQHFSWEIQTRNKELWKTADPLAIENLHEAVGVLKNKYPIAEVYILGFSQGAAYAFLFGFKLPEMTAGIVSIGGLFPETDTEFSMLKGEEIASGKKFRVFIAQGSHDLVIPMAFGAKTAEKLKKYGYEVECQEYEGGHEVTPELLKKIYSWLMKK